MKLYNKNLEEIEDQQKTEKIESTVKGMISFLVEKYGIDEEFLLDKLNSLAVVEHSAKNDKTHLVEKNGETREIKSSRMAAAFYTKKNQEFDGEKWSFENAIYVDEKNFQNELIHELFHFLSANTEMNFDENGIGYDKIGVSIQGYNRDDELVDGSMDAKGLNEGITELLTTQMLNSITRYTYQVHIANILNGNMDNSLIQAYFSKDERTFKNFLQEFDKRQSTVSSEKLRQLKDGIEFRVDTQLLKGCLEYTLSYCNNMEELTEERKRLLPIFKSMMYDLNLEYDEEDFDMKAFVDSVFYGKRDKILLDSAIEATEEKIKTSTINEQAGKIKELAKETEDKSIETEIE